MNSLGVKENLWLHSSQNSFLEYLSHWRRHSWWMYLMDPVQMQGWKRGRSEEASHRQTRHMSEKGKQEQTLLKGLRH